RHGRLQVRGVASHPADDRSRHESTRDHRADDALGDARGPRRGLYPHGAGQGSVEPARHRAPRLSQRADPGDHRDRPPGRRAVHGRDSDRDHLLLARRGQVADRGDQPPRLSGAAGRTPDAGRDGDDGQPAGGRHVRHHQSANQAIVLVSTIVTPETFAALAAPPGPLREFWGYFRKNHGAVAGLAIVVAVLLTAAFANVLAPYSPDLTNNAMFLRPPAWQAGGSWAHLLGTDAIGRDILSRLIFGARLSLLIG